MAGQEELQRRVSVPDVAEWEHDTYCTYMLVWIYISVVLAG